MGEKSPFCPCDRGFQEDALGVIQPDERKAFVDAESEEPVNTIMFVSVRKPEAIIAQDLQQCGLKVQWANSIKAAKNLLVSASERTAIVADLALANGNWTDLFEQVRCISSSIPIVLVSSTSTAEFWWNALDCGVEDILLEPVIGFPLVRNPRATR